MTRTFPRARRARYTLAAASLALLAPAAAVAQIRASEIGTVSQIVDGTKLTIEYSRPRARGRDQIFGTRAVHWGEVWTPGANYATTFELNRDVTLDGHAVPKGKYSIWFVVRQAGPWTMVLDPDAHRYHMAPPDSNARQIRFPVRADSAPFTDVLTWSFPELHASGATIEFRWERRRVAVPMEVAPSLSIAMPEADAAPYLGRYAYVEQEDGGKTTTKTLTVLYENGTLKGEFTPADPYFRRFALVRVAPDVFAPGVYDRTGVVYEVYRPEMMFTFTRASGRAESLEVRDQDDKLQASAKRMP